MTDHTQQFFGHGELVAVLTTQPLGRFLDYKAPAGGVMNGAYVIVPLGPRQVLGVVWGPGEGSFDPARIREITRISDLPPMISAMKTFIERTAEYTLSSYENVLRLATRMPGIGEPPGMRKVIRLGDAEPSRMTDARSRVIAVAEEHGDARFSVSELAGLAGVSASVVKGLVAQSVLIEEVAPRDAPFPHLDADLPWQVRSRPNSRRRHTT